MYFCIFVLFARDRRGMRPTNLLSSIEEKSTLGTNRLYWKEDTPHRNILKDWFPHHPAPSGLREYYYNKQVDKGSKHTAGSTLVSHSEWKQNSDLRTIQNHTGSLRCILSGFFLWRKCLSSAFLSHSSLRQHQKLEWSLHVAHCLNASNFHTVLKWPRSSCMLN